MIEIDGTQGEGGGQILRTSLSLSLITQKPFRIRKIRGKRRRPGLMRQHLTCVQAAAAVGEAKVSGAELRSNELVFRPRAVNAGDYEFDIGTAGSTGLVLQTILPALWTVDGQSRVVVRGGTHNPMAPSFDFLRDVYGPNLATIGPQVEFDIERHGFYPAGGGEVSATLSATNSGSRLDLNRRENAFEGVVEALVANLPVQIAERESEHASELLNWPNTAAQTRVVDSIGPGNLVAARLTFDDGRKEIFTAYGEKGRRAEKVAEDLVSAVQDFVAARVPVGPHLADQLLLPLATSENGGEFLTGPPTRHTLTQIESIRRFLPEVDICCERQGEERIWLISVEPT